MGIKELFEKYLEFLWKTFMFDMDVFSNGWLYAFLLIPAFFYLLFFLLKWSLLLLPFYGPFVLIANIIKAIKMKEK